MGVGSKCRGVCSRTIVRALLDPFHLFLLLPSLGFLDPWIMVDTRRLPAVACIHAPFPPPPCPPPPPPPSPPPSCAAVNSVGADPSKVATVGYFTWPRTASAGASDVDFDSVSVPTAAEGTAIRGTTWVRASGGGPFPGCLACCFPWCGGVPWRGAGGRQAWREWFDGRHAPVGVGRASRPVGWKAQAPLPATLVSSTATCLPPLPPLIPFR